MAEVAPKFRTVKRFNRETKTYEPVRLPVGPDHFYTMVEAQMSAFADYKIEECPLADVGKGVGDILYVGSTNANTVHAAVKVLRVTAKSVIVAEVRGVLEYSFVDIDYDLNSGEPDIQRSLKLEWTPCADRLVPENQMIFRWNDTYGLFKYKNQFLTVCTEHPRSIWPLNFKSKSE